MVMHILIHSIMFAAFYSPEPLALHKKGVFLAVLFSVGILLAAFFAAIFAIHWQKKLKQNAAKSEILSGNVFYYFTT